MSEARERLVETMARCAQNLRNVANAHVETGDDPLLEGVITESGYFPSVRISELLTAFADNLDEALRGVVDE